MQYVPPSLISQLSSTGLILINEKKVYKATQSASKEIKEAETWEKAHSWLADRR